MLTIQKGHLQEKGEGLVKVHVCYESGRIGWVLGEMNVAFRAEGDAMITSQPEGLRSSRDRVEHVGCTLQIAR